MAKRTTVLAALAIAGVAAAAPLAAQWVEAPPGRGTGLILGQVVDADSGRPIPGALVTLGPPLAQASSIGELTEMRAPSPPAGAGERVLAAADGRFVFRNLPRGEYGLSADAPGFVAGTYGQLRIEGPGQSIDLAEAEKLGNVRVGLWRTATITGVVRHDNGEPAVGVTVACRRGVVTGGHRRFATAGGSVATDDRGMYRVADLVPGDYLCGIEQSPRTTPASVVADFAEQRTGMDANLSTPESRRLQNSGGSASSGGMRVGEFIFTSGASTLRGAAPPPPDADGRMMTYPPVYYPSSQTTAGSTRITIAPGEERGGIDMQMRLVPAVRVSGRLTGPDGPGSYLGVRLVPVDGDDFSSEGQAEFAYTTSDGRGAFTFLGVPAGEYVLKCRMYPRAATGFTADQALDDTTLWAAARVIVGRTDIRDLSIALRAGMRVSGRVQFDGAREVAPAAQQRISVRLQGADGRTSSPIPTDARVRADGTFTTAGFPTGRYIVTVLGNTIPPGWSVKSVIANGRDVSVEPFVLSDADIANVVVTLTDRKTMVSGTVTGANGLDAEAIAFPADSTAWKQIGVVSRRSRVVRVNKVGAFEMTGLPPGDYFVVAVPGSLAGNRQDPAFLEALVKSATRITLADGGSALVSLMAVRR